MPRVSIIVPVYNVEDYLEKCLDSILKQNFSDYEVIIVNDGSTDKSAVIATRYVKKYPNNFKLISQNNGGLGAARNTGIDNANGEFYLFLDSDDTITGNALSHLYDKATENNADIVVFDYKLIDEKGTELGIESGCGNSASNFFNSSLEENPSLLLINPSACNKFFRSTLFNDTGIKFPAKVWYEDLRTVAKLYIDADVIVYSNVPLYNYVQRSGSIMHSDDIGRNKEIMEAMDDLITYYKNLQLFERYKEELEFLAVFHVLLLGSVRVNKLNYDHPLMNSFYNYIKRRFPEYKENKYVKGMNRKEKIILELLSKKRFLLLNLILKIKQSIKK